MSFEIPDNLGDLAINLVMLGVQLILTVVIFGVRWFRRRQTREQQMICDKPAVQLIDPETFFSDPARDLLAILRSNNHPGLTVDTEARKLTLSLFDRFGNERDKLTVLAPKHGVHQMYSSVAPMHLFPENEYYTLLEAAVRRIDEECSEKDDCAFSNFASLLAGNRSF